MQLDSRSYRRRRAAQGGQGGAERALLRRRKRSAMDFEEEVEFHLNHLRDHGFTIVKNVRLRQRHPTVTHPGPA